MATTLLPSTEHHFGPMASSYMPPAYDPYSAQQTVHSNTSPGLTSSGDQRGPYTSPQRWAAQQTFQRRTSKSPNIQDRTPIRHSRAEMARHRSSSRSEILLAYAEEQQRQSQQGQQTGAQNLFVPSMSPSAQSYQQQNYAFASLNPPYVPQQPYYDSNPGPTGYGQLVSQHDPNANATIYSGPRSELQLPQAQAVTLNPSDTVFSQPTPGTLPSMASVPSSFPPIPQPLESTPNEVDVAGSRQKPQCWDHGCNGRQFSTFSNLLRHQREKSGTATKARCPHCGTEFTRTTARNGHLYGGKCKGMPDQAKDANQKPKEENP